MKISNYVDFYLVKGHSKSKDKDYYCISMQLDGRDFPLIFISKDTYDLLSSKLK